MSAICLTGLHDKCWRQISKACINLCVMCYCFFSLVAMLILKINLQKNWQLPALCHQVSLQVYKSDGIYADDKASNSHYLIYFCGDFCWEQHWWFVIGQKLMKQTEEEKSKQYWKRQKKQLKLHKYSILNAILNLSNLNNILICIKILLNFFTKLALREREKSMWLIWCDNIFLFRELFQSYRCTWLDYSYFSTIYIGLNQTWLSFSLLYQFQKADPLFWWRLTLFAVNNQILCLEVTNGK